MEPGVEGAPGRVRPGGGSSIQGRIEPDLEHAVVEVPAKRLGGPGLGCPAEALRHRVLGDAAALEGMPHSGSITTFR